MIVSPLIARNCEFLQNFNSKTKRVQQKAIEGASDEQLLCFVEICLNVLEGRVPLRKRHLRKMALIKDRARTLSRSRCPRSARHVLLQRGTGIPAIAGLLTSIVVPLLVDKLINK